MRKPVATVGGKKTPERTRGRTIEGNQTQKAKDPEVVYTEVGVAWKTASA